MVMRGNKLCGVNEELPNNKNEKKTKRVLGGVTECASWRHSWHFTTPYLSEQPASSHCASAVSWESQLFSANSTLYTNNTATVAVTKDNIQSSGSTRSGINGVFPWRRQGLGNLRSVPSPGGLRPSTPQGTHTAPVTPVKELLRDSDSNGQYRRSPGLSKSVRHSKSSSSPLDDNPIISRSDWDIRRAWSQDCQDIAKLESSKLLSSEATLPLVSHSRLHDDDISLSQRNISVNTSESVLQKFRKSLALKFHKKTGSKEGIEAGYDSIEESLPIDLQCSDSPPLRDDANSDSKFKFGPLVWRSSKERKKGKKAARNAKCNSGDSGIQIEMVAGSGHFAGGDSSESHDTDHQFDDEPLDEMDSPPAL